LQEIILQGFLNCLSFFLLQKYIYYKILNVKMLKKKEEKDVKQT